jgi:hypothetical protein
VRLNDPTWTVWFESPAERTDDGQVVEPPSPPPLELPTPELEAPPELDPPPELEPELDPELVLAAPELELEPLELEPELEDTEPELDPELAAPELLELEPLPESEL